jgi:hypothetical protein
VSASNVRTGNAINMMLVAAIHEIGEVTALCRRKSMSLRSPTLHYAGETPDQTCFNIKELCTLHTQCIWFYKRQWLFPWRSIHSFVQIMEMLCDFIPTEFYRQFSRPFMAVSQQRLFYTFIFTRHDVHSYPRATTIKSSEYFIVVTRHSICLTELRKWSTR